MDIIFIFCTCLTFLVQEFTNLYFFGHYFWTRNFRKPIRGSKDSDFSLVSDKNLSEILSSSDWALGQETLAKTDKNLPHLWCHSQKNETQQFFFIANLKTCHIFWGFEQVSSAVDGEVMELQSDRPIY